MTPPPGAANPQAHYRSEAVVTASPVQLVVMLYDGAIAAIATAQRALAAPAEADSLALVHRELTRAQSIILELQLAIDHEKGGVIAISLASLYDFCLDRLVTANLTKSAEPLGAVTRTLVDLREAWGHAASTLAVPA